MLTAVIINGIDCTSAPPAVAGRIVCRYIFELLRFTDSDSH